MATGVSNRTNAWRDRAWLAGLASAVLVFGFTRTQPRFTEDQAVFTTVFDGIARGDRLYVDVFDHKDPIFFWLGGISFRLFGVHGPFLMELALYCLLGFAMFVLARNRELDRPTAAALAFVAVAFLVRPVTYEGLSTSTAGLALVALGTMFAVKGRVQLAGFVLASVVFAKMPYTPLILPAAVVVARTFGRSAVKQMVGAGALAVVMWILVLVVRGEFVGYLDSIALNWSYSQRPQAGSEHGGVRGHIGLLRNLVFDSGSTSLLMVIGLMFTSSALLTVIGHRRGWGSPAALAPLTAAAMFAISVMVLALTYFWPHHMQVLVLAVGLLSIEVAHVVRRSTWRWLGLVCVGFILVWPTMHDRRAASNVANRWTVRDPYAAIELESIFGDLQPVGEVDLALVNGHIQAVMPFIDDRFDLSCPYFFQHAWFEHRIAETAACMAAAADFVVRFDRANQTQLPSSSADIAAILDANFELRDQRTLPDGTQLLVFESLRPD